MTVQDLNDEAPYSLLSLSASILAQHPLWIASNERESYELWPSVALPVPAAEALYSSCKNQKELLDDRQLSLFTDGVRMPIVDLNLEGSRVSDRVLNQILRAQANHVRNINLRNCRELTQEANELLGSPQIHMPQLITLDLGNLVSLFKKWADDVSDVRRYLESINQPSPDQQTQPLSTSSSGNFTWDYRSATPFQHCLPGDIRASSSLSSPADAAAGSSGSCLVAGSSLALGGSSTAQQAIGGQDNTSPHQAKFGKVGVSSRADNWLSDAGSVSPDVFAASAVGANNIFYPFVRDRDRFFSSNRSASIGFANHITAACPNLLAFTIHGDTWDEVFSDIAVSNNATTRCHAFLSMVLEPLARLLYLDLSYWPNNPFRFLSSLDRLETLILHDVPDLGQVISTICQIRSLRNLDLSQTDSETGKYTFPARTLHFIVTSLPHLCALDISSTNLASHPSEGDDIWQTVGQLVSSVSSDGGRESADLKSSSAGLKSSETDDANDMTDVLTADIIGLRGLKAPLEFIGLYNCDGACTYKQIPARRITGDRDEEQILLACEQYIMRPGLMHHVLSDVYRIYRYGEPVQFAKALRLVVSSMEIHVANAEVQVSGSAALFYIMKRVEFTVVLRNRVVSVFLSALRRHTEENVLVRNCCLSLCQFEVPKDLMFAYTDTAKLLLDVIEKHPNDNMTQRIVVYLLNSMACHVEGGQKVAVGELGAVAKILHLISRRLDALECDEVMEISWSFLWNITDETPTNCEKFLSAKGMELFQRCFQAFGDKNDLLRNMMGLMGNIAEVPWLRPRLMRQSYVMAFVALMENFSDGIEISYNSAGVLSHIVSDSAAEWNMVAPSREEVMDKIVEVIRHWKVHEKRYINYRSFEPIIRLLPLFSCPAAQQWAVWALANLTTVDKTRKYCRFVRDEGGIPLLTAIRDSSTSSDELKNLVNVVLNNVEVWLQLGADGLGSSNQSGSSVMEENEDD